MNLLSKILPFLETVFSYVYTSVAGAFHTILSEIPDDEIAILHGAMSAASSKLKSGGSIEEAITAGLNYLEAAEVQECKAVLRALLEAFVNAAAPAPTA
jgi:hypothetical protein